MKRHIFTSNNTVLEDFGKRPLFDLKKDELEKKREQLDRQIRREEREAKIVLVKEDLKEFSAKAKNTQKSKPRKRRTTQSICTLRAVMQRTSFWVGAPFSVFVGRTKSKRRDS